MISDAYNREEVRAVEIPAANGIGTARSVAKAYGCVATGGSDLGLTASTLDALVKPAIPPTKGLRDKVLRVDTTFSLGYIKPFPKFRFGSSTMRSERPELGGSFGFADPDTGIGFAYAMNRSGFHLYNDPRELALRQALVPRHRRGAVANLICTPSVTPFSGQTNHAISQQSSQRNAATRCLKMTSQRTRARTAG